MTLFDKKQPGVRAIPSSFGGGWIISLTPEGSRVLGEYFDAEPTPIAPLGGLAGYIVEPQDAGAAGIFGKPIWPTKFWRSSISKRKSRSRIASFAATLNTMRRKR